MKYLVSSVDTYRVDSVEEVERFHEELKNDTHFTLASFGYKHKEVKQKGEVIDEYELVTVKKLFNIEKEPDKEINIKYEVDF
jgi:hypothetical protein